MMKTLLYVILTVVLGIVAIGVFVFQHTTIVNRKALQEFQVTDHSNERPARVTIDGRLIGGILAISGVRQVADRDSVLVVARAGLTRPGRRTARFHYDVTITSDVDQISFGTPDDIVWRRER